MKCILKIILIILKAKLIFLIVLFGYNPHWSQDWKSGDSISLVFYTRGTKQVDSEDSAEDSTENFGALGKGAEVDLVDKKGQTPLHVACFKGHVDAARLLLDKGADIDRVNKRGETPLYAACSKGHVDAARLLLDIRLRPDPQKCPR